MDDTVMEWDTYVLENAIKRLRRMWRDDALRHASRGLVGKLGPSPESSGPCASEVQGYEEHISLIAEGLYGMAEAMEKWLQGQLDAVRAMDKGHAALLGGGARPGREEG